MNPKISVILPVFNGECHIRETVESILDQTFSEFEFIIIDDGSKDKTWEILKEYESNDDRIRLIRNEENLGIVESLNKGLKAASTNLIARMDCGDICEKERFELQYNYLTNNYDILLCTTQGYWTNKEGEIVSKTLYPCDNYGIKKELYFMKNNIIHPAVMFRWDGKTFYRNFTYPAEDYDMWLRLWSNKFYRIDKPLIRIREGGGGISFENRLFQAKVTRLVNRLFIERILYGFESKKTVDKLIQLHTEHKKKKEKHQLYKFFASKGLQQKKGSMKWFFYMMLANLVAPELIVQKSIIRYRILKNIINSDKILNSIKLQEK